MKQTEVLEKMLTDAGAFKTGLVKTQEIRFDPAFRAACEANQCGNYGRCWACPPYAGEIDTLIERAKTFPYALVYQTVTHLEDSYDFKGMLEAGNRHNQITLAFIKAAKEFFEGEYLPLAAGGCHLCPVCAKRENLPCRRPEDALSSLEAYGVSVSDLARCAGMQYTNGVDTVTYFGAILFHGLKEV